MRVSSHPAPELQQNVKKTSFSGILGRNLEVILSDFNEQAGPLPGGYHASITPSCTIDLRSSMV
jgi:hypothetical protein